MSAFMHTSLEEGEVLVIGPVRYSSSSSVSFGGGSGQKTEVSRAKQRTIGITNRRVIVETGNPRDTLVLYNTDVKRLFLKRDKRGITIKKLETMRGQTVKLDMGGLRPVEEARLFDLFPQADVGLSKGLFGGFERLSPPPVSAPRMPSQRKPAPASRPPQPVPSVPVAPAPLGMMGSHIDDPDIHSLEDLRRYYPLSREYAYAQTDDGTYVVERLSDGAQFTLLLEAELLTFDVPIEDPKRRKTTVEVFKHR